MIVSCASRSSGPLVQMVCKEMGIDFTASSSSRSGDIFMVSPAQLRGILGDSGCANLLKKKRFSKLPGGRKSAKK